MHFYADANIYGMSEMTVMNFKFRRNFDEGRMRNFQKIFIEKTFHNTFDYFFEVFDLVDLQETKPDLFSPLSYIEFGLFLLKYEGKRQHVMWNWIYISRIL